MIGHLISKTHRVHPAGFGRGSGSGDLKAASIRQSLLRSIEALGGGEPELRTRSSKKIRVFYLHAPDRKTPLEESVEAINELHQEDYL